MSYSYWFNPSPVLKFKLTVNTEITPRQSCQQKGRLSDNLMRFRISMMQVPRNLFDKVTGQVFVMIKSKEHRPTVSHYFSATGVHTRFFNLHKLIPKNKFDNLLVFIEPLINIYKFLFSSFKSLWAKYFYLLLNFFIHSWHESFTEILSIHRAFRMTISKH